jgi:hypothetical protein
MDSRSRETYQEDIARLDGLSPDQMRDPRATYSSLARTGAGLNVKPSRGRCLDNLPLFRIPRQTVHGRVRHCPFTADQIITFQAWVVAFWYNTGAMARMIPPEIPEPIRSDPKRSAEIRVYSELDKQLPDSFTVYYSRPWRQRLGNGSVVDGEADFVIASPDWGILVIEVKGGRVARDGRADRWTSTDRNDEVHSIKNPVQQARQSMHVLLDRLKRFPWFRERFIKIGYAVILPDCGQPADDLGIEMPLEMFAWAEHMDGLRKRLLRMLWPAAQPDPEKQHDLVGERGIAILDDLLAKSFCLELPFGALLGRATRRIVELTANQFWILDALDRNSRVAVSGGAGTGKTVLAFEKARRMASHGTRTLLLCFNKGIVEALSSAHHIPRALTIRTFHSLAGNMCQQAGIQLDEPPESGRAAFYRNQLPNGLLAAIDKRPDLRFDAVIIDEAQDFEESWWVPIELLLNDTQISPLYVFFDDNQNIFGRQSHLLSNLPFRFQLTRNLRNATSVFASFAPYYVGSAYEAGTDLPGEVSFHPEINTQAALASFVARLVRVDHIPPSQIAVLSCRPLEDSLFSLHQFSLATSLELPIRCESVWRFKGLEAPVVVLTDIDGALHNREVLYTALSRAQVRLCVLGFAGPLPLFPSGSE